MDGNLVMDKGRTLIKSNGIGKKAHAGTLGKSWKGTADSPVADTNKPVLVRDDSHEQPVHLHAEEAERLMGMPTGCTRGKGITNKQRLRCIGNGWDLSVLSLFMRQYREELLKRTTLLAFEASIPVLSATLTDNQKLMQLALVFERDNSSDGEFACMLSKQSAEDMMHMYALIRAWDQANPSSSALIAAPNSSVLDSGASRHLHPLTSVTNTEDRVSITGFDGSEA